MVRFLKDVEISCKSTCNSLRKTYAKKCEKLSSIKIHVEKSTFPQTFSNFLTSFSTIVPSLSPPKLFHFYTNPIITIIK